MGSICSSPSHDSPFLRPSLLRYSPNNIINGFMILSLLGEGGFGKVFLVKEISTLNKFAIKSIDKGMAKDLNMQSRAV